jgi:hypothetical protein
MFALTRHSGFKPNFTGLPQSGGQPDRAHWERIAGPVTGCRGPESGCPTVLEGLMSQECQTTKLSSIANLATVSLVWREPLKSNRCPPWGI